MRLFVTFHGGHIGSVFADRKKAERYPGPRMLEAAHKTISEMVGAEWEDADAFKPEHQEPVLLWRLYNLPLKTGQPEGFVSYGRWFGGKWHDDVFCCPAHDVKLWHELPPAPMTAAESEKMYQGIKDHLARPD